MPKHLFVISIDSLTFEDFKVLQTYPQTKALMENSSIIKRVHSPFPTLTYPCHTTLATGCYPNKTGIAHNLSFPDMSWQHSREAIQVPTILEIAQAHDLSSACICWPVLGGSYIDWVIPETWAPTREDDPAAAFEPLTSFMAQDICKKHLPLLDWMKTPGFDYFATACTADIIKEGKPNLLLSHLSYLDHQKHQTGIEPALLPHAYSFIDECLGKMIQATKDAGILEETTFILLGDHGLQDIHTVFNVNAVFKEKGFYRSNDDWELFGMYAGCASQIYVKGITKAEARSVLQEIVEQYPTVLRPLLDSEDLNALHLTGDFEFCLEAQTYYTFGKGEDIVFEKPYSAGYSLANHGYVSEHGPEATCILQTDKNDACMLEETEMVDIAPTILSLLDLQAPSYMDGKAITF